MINRAENFSDRAKKNLSILDTIRRSGPISKTDISSIIGVNVVTVSNYIDEFLRQKLIFEKELDVSKGGRRPVLLDLNSESGYALGVGINLLHATAVLVDMRGNLILSVKRERPQQKSSEVVDTILQLIKDILSQANVYKDKIKGVGIGMAGIIDNKRETVRWPEKSGEGYNYSLIALPLKETIEKEFGFSVRIDNDATVACFAEQWLVQEAQMQNLLYMFSGVGCGIIINGEVYRGASGCAGEMAICVSGESCPKSIEEKHLHFLRRWELDCGILESVEKGLSSHKDSKVYELCSGRKDNLSLEMICKAVEAEDSFALEIIKEAAGKCGIKVAFLVNVFNPQMVIIGGGLEKMGRSFIDEIRRSVAKWSFEEAAGAVKIVPSRLGDNAVSLGAANLVVRDVFANITKE